MNKYYKVRDFSSGKFEKRYKKVLKFFWKLFISVWLTGYSVVAVWLLFVQIDKSGYIMPVEAQEAKISQNLQPQDEIIKDYVLEEVKKVGIDEYKVWALLTMCENRSWNKEATLINRGGELGIDRGLWQINSKFHPEVSNSCAYDYRCSTKEAIRIIKERGFKEWTCGKKLGL